MILPLLPKRSWILLLATWMVIGLLTKTVPESAHEFSRLGTVDSLVERWTYQLDDSIFIDTLDKVLSNGHFYSHQPPLLATLESPVYWVLHLPGMRFNNRTRELTVFFFVVLTNGLALAFLWMRRDVKCAEWRAFALGLAVPLLAHALINIPITGDVVPAGFHHELFDYPGAPFDEASLSGSVKHQSPAALASYAWRALFTGKGYFTFAPVLALGLIVGVAGWRWWARARGAHLVLLGSTALSLAASLLMTNNFGGGAVGFRHATYLAPAMLTLLLPVLADRRPEARAGGYAIGAVAALSMVLMLLFEVKQPWPNMTFPPAEVGSWQSYFPIVAKVVSGNLLNP